MIDSKEDIKLNPLEISVDVIPFGHFLVNITQREPYTKPTRITLTDDMIDSLCAILLGVKTNTLDFSKKYKAGATK